jgi:arsenate reductase-like glutaredoxin family protein
MIIKAAAMTAKKKQVMATPLSPDELNKLVTGIESDLRKALKKRGEDLDRPIVKELLARTYAALRKTLGVRS